MMMTTMISWAAAREIAMKMGTVLVISFATNVTTTTKSPVAKTTEKVERIKTTASGRATRMTTTMMMTMMISWAAAREIAMKMGTVLVISFATNVTTTTKSPVAKTTEKVERIKTTASGRA